MEFEANNRIAVTSGVILLAFCILTGVLWTVTRSPQQLVAREKNYNLTQHSSSTERGKEAPSEASPAASQKQQQGAKTSSAGSPVPASSQEQKTQSPETTDTGIETTAPVAPPKKKKPKPQKPRPQFDDTEDTGRAQRSRDTIFPDILGIFN